MLPAFNLISTSIYGQSPVNHISNFTVQSFLSLKILHLQEKEMNKQDETNMPHPLLQSWRHKKIIWTINFAIFNIHTQVAPQ